MLNLVCLTNCMGESETPPSQEPPPQTEENIDPALLASAEAIVERTNAIAKLKGTDVNLNARALARHWQENKTTKNTNNKK